MKTFEQALEEAIDKCKSAFFKKNKILINEKDENAIRVGYDIGFDEGAQWAIQNLHLLDAKDLLKHEDVKKVVEALEYAEAALAVYSVTAYGHYKPDLEVLVTVKKALKPFAGKT
jgi:hypothetical protein